MGTTGQLSHTRSLARPDREVRETVGRWLPKHFTRDVSAIYRLAVSDPFDRDIRPQRERGLAGQTATRKAPVRRLGEMPPVVQGVLMALYARSPESVHFGR